ncbi:hypothetical protein J4234_02825 [Candidatus Woesearchaeota archaeon]|nr:hypothetical protein [Candidatus Woesearchaeota archaeon]
MIIQKRWGDARENARGLAFNFGVGTIFSLIAVYFIYLHSKEKEWTLLALVSKWYLIIAGGLMLLSLAVILFVILISLLIFLVTMIKFKKVHKKHKNAEYLDAEYKIKE